MDLQDQLKQLFPEHTVEESSTNEPLDGLWIPDAPVECHFEKRRGKPVTILKGYTGNKSDFAMLAKDLKKYLGVGGSSKNEEIMVQGDYREKIMSYLTDRGFKVTRVGG